MTEIRNIPTNSRTNDYLLAGKETMMAKRRKIILKRNEFNDKLDSLIFRIEQALAYEPF